MILDRDRLIMYSWENGIQVYSVCIRVCTVCSFIFTISKLLMLSISVSWIQHSTVLF